MGKNETEHKKTEYKNYYYARQHLNLSREAYDVLEADGNIFMEKPSRAGIINLVLAAYMNDADAAIPCAEERYRDMISKKLESVPPGEMKEEIVEALTRAYIDDLLRQIKSYPKEVQFKIQLSDDNYTAMESWRDPNQYYQSSPGAFLKAVLEEYARKSYYEREEIIFKDMITAIQGAINSRNLLIITLKEGRQFEVKPFQICPDAETSYHYLTGMARKKDTDYADRPMSFRLSNIIKVHVSAKRSGKIEKSAKTELQNRIRAVGVQFMLNDPQIIRVRLSRNGKKMYDRQLHLRPKYSTAEKQPDGTWLCEFCCTGAQARFYFFKFGSDAEVLEPQWLRDQFQEGYRTALQRYGVVGESGAGSTV